ncbi:MAG: OmpA family protein [Deltaproteobacteria bacterium]|nr:OmpA family protein [Deltaproteobacteria bacterium]
MTVGDRHACVWTDEGAAVCWGENRRGQVGVGAGSGRCRPIATTMGTRVRQLGARQHHTCALDTAGTITCWGDHPGRPGRAPNAQPDRVPVPGQAVALATGREHGCAIVEGGQVWCWGSGAGASFADGPRPAPMPPRRVPAITEARALAVSGSASCVVNSSGAVRCWGRIGGLLEDPTPGQLLFGPTTLRGESARPSVAFVGDVPCVASNDGHVRCWGSATRPRPVPAPRPMTFELGGAMRVFGSDLATAGCALVRPDAPACTADDCPPGRLECFDLVAPTPGRASPKWPHHPGMPNQRDSDAFVDLSLSHRHFGPNTILGCAVGRDGGVQCWAPDGAARDRDDLAAVARGQWATDVTTACRDIDSDGDGPSDEADRCPHHAETYNGHEDGDGCPDEGESLVEVDEVGGVIRLRHAVRFETGKDRLHPTGQPVLGHLAGAIAGYPRFTRIEIQGHRGDHGQDAFGRKPTQRRAEEVRDSLISRGIDARRLTAVGYGEERPIEPNRTARGRAANERIEVHILEVAP